MILTVSLKHEEKETIKAMNQSIIGAEKWVATNPVLSDEVKGFYKMMRNIVGQIARQVEHYDQTNRQIRESIRIKAA
jgi:hypothetical protein